MLYIHKNGIGLRKIEIQDLNILKDLKNESWFGTHRIAIVNDHNQKQWFDSISNSHTDLFLMAFDMNQDKNLPVGVYKIQHIDWINRSYDSAHDVLASARGKGYGYTVLEAGVDFGFEVLNMHRIDTEVLINNKASMKTALFAGYKEEGLRRKAVYKCGEWIDSVVMGILREDWENLERIKDYKNICNISYKPMDKNG